MGQTRVHRLAFNRGIVSRLGVARADVKRLAWACTIMTNWMTRVLGSMMLRPGTGYLASTYLDAKAFYIPFVFSITEKALVELTDRHMRVVIDDALVTRSAVGTAVANGTFTTDLTSWTDADESGATSDWVATGGDTHLWTPAGLMRLTGNSVAYAIRRQQVAIAVADQATEHGLLIYVARGPVILRVGSTSGDDDLISQTTLATGEHHLTFTPVGASAWIEFKSNLNRQVLIDQCTVEAAGTLVLNAPWLLADLGLQRYDQSGDVIFVASGKTTDKIGYQQWRIERHATRAWSVALYLPEDGPFRIENVTPITLQLSPGGNPGLLASVPLFKAGHVGSLFSVTTPGQSAQLIGIGAESQFSQTSVKVTGVGATRNLIVTVAPVTGTGTTVVLQSSTGSADGPWSTAASYTTDQSAITFNDTLDNQDIWYRIGVPASDYSTGSIAAAIYFAGGETRSVVRILSLNSAFVANCEALTEGVRHLLHAFNLADPTAVWAEGQWSDYRGWPTAVAFNEGRLCWAGRDNIVESVSDQFDGFDPNTEGDSGPINRTIGSGPVDSINWLLPLQRLIAGAQGAEFSVRASSLDEIVTPTNFNMKRASTQGSAAVQAVAIDQNGAYIQRGGTRVFELEFGQDGIDYNSNHLSALCPEIGEPGVIRLVVQRQPDTRLHCIRSDGTAFVVVFDKVEQVICFLNIDSTGMHGLIEDAVVLPGDVGDKEDFVYYVVKRTGSNGVVHRFLEKWAFEDECRGDTISKLADCHVAYSGVPTTTISAPHLFNENVCIWADGADIGTADDYTQTYTLNSGGELHLEHAVTNYVVGLPYSAPWQSSRFAETMAQGDGALTSTAKIKSVSMILADVHRKGLRFGQSLDATQMDDLPGIGEEGDVVDADAVRVDYTLEPSAFPGSWNNNARLCLLAQAPRPVTVLATPLEIEYHG